VLAGGGRHEEELVGLSLCAVSPGVTIAWTLLVQQQGCIIKIFISLGLSAAVKSSALYSKMKLSFFIIKSFIQIFGSADTYFSKKLTIPKINESVPQQARYSLSFGILSFFSVRQNGIWCQMGVAPYAWRWC